MDFGKTALRQSRDNPAQSIHEPDCRFSALALYLGQQSIVSTEPSRFSIKSAPVFETLRFSVPASTKIRKFNEITVMLLPDTEHAS
jgi:hypothetical protein